MKGNKGWLVVGFIVLVAFIASSVVIQNETIQDFVNTLIAVIGAVAIWYQLKKEKDIAEGEFIVDLNNAFVNHDGIKNIYTKLRVSQTVEENIFDAEKDRQYIVDYLTYFETLYVLYRKKIFTIPEIDKMFAYRFFIAINDPRIQQIELEENWVYYEDLYQLYLPWEKYRKKKGKGILNEPFSFKRFYEQKQSCLM